MSVLVLASGLGRRGASHGAEAGKQGSQHAAHSQLLLMRGFTEDAGRS